MTIGNAVWMVVCLCIAFVMAKMPFWQEQEDERREKMYEQMRRRFENMKKENEDA